MKDDTRPFRFPVHPGKKPKTIFIIIALIAAVIVISLVLILLKRSGIPIAVSPELSAMQDIIGKITTLESGIERINRETAGLASDYKTASGEDIQVSLDIANPTQEEKRFLTNKIENEQDAALKSLLSRIYDKRILIEQTRDNLKKLEARLPPPHIVEKRETHFQICLDFLVQERSLSREEAQSIIDKDKLLETIVPGFKVWNFYSDRQFVSFVTRGEATVSPEEVSKAVEQKIISEKNRALRELNSLYYIIDSKKNLLKNEILEGGLFKPYKLKDVPAGFFKKSIDLRMKKRLFISASFFKLDKITQVVLYPRIYKEDTDYKIMIAADKRKAAFSILNVEAFKNEKVVISVE